MQPITVTLTELRDILKTTIDVIVIPVKGTTTELKAWGNYLYRTKTDGYFTVADLAAYPNYRFYKDSSITLTRAIAQYKIKSNIPRW